MSTGDVPGVGLYWPDAVPIRIYAHTETSSGNTVPSNTNTSIPGGILVLAVEVVALGAGPIECFCDVLIPDNTVVYHDSQSIGGGGGVRFMYRSQAVLLPGERMSVRFSSDSPASWSIGAWGLALPFFTLQL